MKTMKKYWASILLFAIAVFSIPAIFLWPAYKDTFTALITVSLVSTKNLDD